MSHLRVPQDDDLHYVHVHHLLDGTRRELAAEVQLCDQLVEAGPVVAYDVPLLQRQKHRVPLVVGLNNAISNALQNVLAEQLLLEYLAAPAEDGPAVVVHAGVPSEADLFAELLRQRPHGVVRRAPCTQLPTQTLPSPVQKKMFTPVRTALAKASRLRSCTAGSSARKVPSTSTPKYLGSVVGLTKLVIGAATPVPWRSLAAASAEDTLLDATPFEDSTP
ncbi:threonyl-tRNA synthetase [Babesia caballi]|uniref:Threonyl-tRNA synthetase n=1 Tax=Babesia caballi TaxID=5871 RepID=A0AAV4LZB2_BABCB|nr:threonyl-tRNA synthetase [Babesia caballi]